MTSDISKINVFRDRLLTTDRSDIFGRHAWFIWPVGGKRRRQYKLKCVINDDATVSACSTPNLKFTEAKELIAAIAEGSVKVDDDFKIPTQSCSFITNLCFAANGTKTVSNYLRYPTSPLPTIEQFEADPLVCPGFTVNNAVVKRVHSAWIKEDGDVVRGRNCSGRKCAWRALCEHCQPVKKRIQKVVKQLKRSSQRVSSVERVAGQRAIWKR